MAGKSTSTQLFADVLYREGQLSSTFIVSIREAFPGHDFDKDVLTATTTKRTYSTHQTMMGMHPNTLPMRYRQ